MRGGILREIKRFILRYNEMWSQILEPEGHANLNMASVKSYLMLLYCENFQITFFTFRKYVFF